MLVDIDIIDWAAISPLGLSKEEIWDSYCQPLHCLDLQNEWGGSLKNTGEAIISGLKTENNKYKNLDRTTLLAMAAGRKLAHNNIIKASCGVNIGSSRGATEQLEFHHANFIQTENCFPSASPNTTLGNLSSWLAQDLKTQGINLSHSVTCSTALHSIANAAAWLNAGFSEQFIAGGSEAPLTPFSFAQMKAMRIYAPNTQTTYPCQAALADKTQNTMVLGEGAALFLLAKNAGKRIARIKSIGFASEEIEHGSSISESGESMQKAMLMALKNINKEDIDAIVLHSPGTIKGDSAEHNAIQHVFDQHKPLLTCNKWKIGHTLGASGAFSMAFALQMLQEQCFIALPWQSTFSRQTNLNNIMVNAVGFGGNAVSIVLSL